MGDRASAWVRRAASPAALVSLLAIILLAIGGATALARRAPGASADVTVVTVATVSPSTPPAPVAVAPSTPLEVTPAPPVTPAASPAGSPAPTSAPSPSASASPRPSTSPTAVVTPAILGTPVPLPTASATPVGAPAPPIIQAPNTVGVGEAFALHVIAPGAAAVSIELDGSTYSAAAVADRFWLVIGIPVAAPPGPRTIRATARTAAGATTGSSLAPLQFIPVERPVDYLNLTAEQSSVLTEEAGRLEVQLRAAQFAQFDPTKRWVGRFIRPLFGFQTTTFGEGRSINGGPIGGFHSGMDIAADVGDPVRASAAGVVSWVGEMPIRGRSVIIDHGAGVKSGYHHLDLAYVSTGALVEAGHVVGAGGSTGLSTGPHLHWEVTVWGVNVDPLQWTSASFDP